MNRNTCRSLLVIIDSACSSAITGEKTEEIEFHRKEMQHYINNGGIESRPEQLNDWDEKNPWETDTDPLFSLDFEYRIKKTTVTINGIECVAGETEAPDRGVKYWVPQMLGFDTIIDYNWRNNEMDKEYFRKGQVFLKHEDASDMSKALLSAIKPLKLTKPDWA